MRYAKFLVAAAMAALVAVQTAITDDRITTSEWVTIGLAALAAVGVWLVPNKPPAEEPEPRTTRYGG